ncbi:MAG: thioredoxin [Muribaculaceae bacterium]|nr:thioredoxin [Muribaculaceae bacterium]
MAIQFNDESAREAIESGKPVVIDFWATWCGPCIKLGPVIEELAEKYEGKAIVGKINIDEDQEIVAENGIRSIPTVLFFKDGKVQDRCVGLVKLSDLEEKLNPLLG